MRNNVERETNPDSPTIQLTPDEPSPAKEEEEQDYIQHQRMPKQCTKYPIDRHVSFVKLDDKLKCFVFSLQNSNTPKCIVDTQLDSKWNTNI